MYLYLPTYLIVVVPVGAYSLGTGTYGTDNSVPEVQNWNPERKGTRDIKEKVSPLA